MMSRCVVLLCVVGGLVLIVGSSCTFGVATKSPGPVLTRPGPPAHAPAHGYRRKLYQYRYYPSSYVYFDVERKVYFYLEGGNWRVSARLPAQVHIDVGEAVSVSLETDTPYTHFKEHKTQFPPGQLKKQR